MTKVPVRPANALKTAPSGMGNIWPQARGATAMIAAAVNMHGKKITFASFAAFCGILLPPTACSCKFICDDHGQQTL
jgi:hypothetical protein